MGKIVIYHGSTNIIEKPSLSLGRRNNDYGPGYYCTYNLEMAKEWACKQNSDGFVNEYEIDISELKALDLLDGKHTVLNWIALLLNNRIFPINDELGSVAKQFILDNYLINVSDYDIVCGYRADDSYFSYAQSFVHNGMPLRSLTDALKLGDLGTQFVLVSEKAFARIKFVRSIKVNRNEYYPKFINRDLSARTSYKENIKNAKALKDDVFIIDIMRGEDFNDPRL